MPFYGQRLKEGNYGIAVGTSLRGEDVSLSGYCLFRSSHVEKAKIWIRIGQKACVSESGNRTR
jgi:hypothetical protein